MSEINKLKAEYENIRASETLKERIKKTMIKEKRRNKILRGALGLVAGLCIVSVVSLNVFPAFAQAVSDIPGIGSVVKVVTLGKYEHHDGGFEAKIVTPKIEGLLDKELEQRINDEFKENAKAIILAYEQDIKEIKEQYGDEHINMGTMSDYIIKTDSEDILALDVYILNVAGSSSTKHTFYNIDKKTGELLTLRGLFKEDAEYVKVISDYIKEEMIRRNHEEDGLFWVLEGDYFKPFESINETQNFYINSENELVICFDKYEVAAGAQGSPEFVIPSSLIEKYRK